MKGFTSPKNPAAAPVRPLRLRWQLCGQFFLRLGLSGLAVAVDFFPLPLTLH